MEVKSKYVDYGNVDNLHLASAKDLKLIILILMTYHWRSLKRKKLPHIYHWLAFQTFSLLDTLFLAHILNAILIEVVKLYQRKKLKIHYHAALIYVVNNDSALFVYAHQWDYVQLSMILKYYSIYGSYDAVQQKCFLCSYIFYR